MKAPKCPSCGHEVFHKTPQCPFCGHRFSTGYSPSGSGTSPDRKARVIVMAALMIVLVTGSAVMYFATVQRSQAEAEAQSQQEIINREAENQAEMLCIQNAYLLLEAEEYYKLENGQYTENIEQLADINSDLSPTCPSTGEPYRLELDKNSVSVICPVHGRVD